MWNECFSSEFHDYILCIISWTPPQGNPPTHPLQKVIDLPLKQLSHLRGSPLTAFKGFSRETTVTQWPDRPQSQGLYMWLHQKTSLQFQFYILRTGHFQAQAVPVIRWLTPSPNWQWGAGGQGAGGALPTWGSPGLFEVTENHSWSPFAHTHSLKKKLLSLTPNIIHRPSSTGDLKLPLFQHNIKLSSKLEKQVAWRVEMPLLLGRQS